jgi:glycosyltransferase involved in cell wall biosynthesis
MRVLSVLESASRVDGGIFEAELALHRQLAQFSGVEVDVVALRDEFTDADAPRWLPLKPKVGEVMGPRSFGFSPGMGEAMSSGVDVGYCAALWKYPAWAFLNWQKRTRKPAVVAPHGSLDAWALQNSKWKKRIAAAIFKDRQLQNATCFRALCSAEADSIRAYGLKQRIEIVPNGVELAEKLTTEDTESTEGKKRLLFLGRIHPKKGLVGALRAWADIQNSKSKNPNSKQCQFVIAGWDQGEHEQELRALCCELGLKTASRFSHEGTGSTEGQNFKALPPEAEGADVVFFGPAFGEEKEELLRSASAFILPSLSEGLPMSVLEAWAYGLPVVMTPECNLPEGFASQAALEIRNGGRGNRNWEGLRALLDMSDSDRIEMGRRGRRLVEERFTWPKVAAQMHELFQQILAK